MPFAKNRGVRLFWETQGEGTPVFLIMGHSYASPMWYPILADLTARHRVVTFDNRGVGQSDTTRTATINDLVADSMAVMDAAGLERAHVFGVSMGGGIALELALRHGERVTSLIAGCTCAKTADKPSMPVWLRTLFRWAPWIGKVLGRRRAGADHGYGSAAPADRVAVDQKMLADNKASAVGVVAQADAIANYATTLEAVAGLTMPALVIHGDEDKAVPYVWGVELAKTLPNNRFITIKGAGHNFFITGGQGINDEILRFIDQVDRGEPIKAAPLA